MYRFKYILSLIIITVSLANIALHIGILPLPVSFGYDGWRSVTDRQVSSEFLVISVIFFFLLSQWWYHKVTHRSIASSKPNRKSMLAPFVMLLFWVILFWLFWHFRISVGFGDSGLIPLTMEPPVPQPRWPLAFSFLLFIHQTLGKMLGLSPLESLRLTSSLCGATIAMIFFGIVRLLFERDTRQILLFALFFPSAYGLIQLWFGYPEIYAIVALSWSVLIWVCLLFLERKVPLLLVSIVSGVVCLFYIANVLIFIPYLLLIAIAAKRLHTVRDRLRLVIPNFLVLLTTASMIFVFVLNTNPIDLWQDQMKQSYINLGSSADSMFYSVEDLLSTKHLLEFANEWILIDLTGIVLSLLSPAIWFLSRSEWTFNQSMRALLMGLMVMAFWVLSFLYEPMMGYPTDWDVFSYLAMFTSLFGAYVFLRGNQLFVSRFLYGVIVASSGVHLVAMLFPLIMTEGPVDSRQIAYWINLNSPKSHIFVAPIFRDDFVVVSLTPNAPYRSLDTRDTVVLPSNLLDRDVIYIFPREEEKRMQALAERLGSSGAREPNTWRNLPLLYRIPFQNLPDIDAPLLALANGGDFLKSQYVQSVLWENGIQLLGYSIAAENSGYTPAVRLYLRTLKKHNTNLTLSVKIRDGENRVLGQEDKWAGNNSFGTLQWDIGDIIIEEFHVNLETCSPGGEFSITIEIYDAETMQVNAVADSADTLVVLNHTGSMCFWTCPAP